ncbi:MAG: nucleoside 2-deoxyribosyltransferase [Ignavibacteriaceae bacterium]|nr:nucleoside 2-deoxyribosyltransferase [Ignavibacteriaceae bacterium]
MNIYCAGPIKGDKTYQQFYKKIIAQVSKHNFTAFSEFNILFEQKIKLNNKKIYERDIAWLRSSKAMIAEVSGPSLGVGFEISYALFELKIPVLALYNREVKKVSAMIAGCSSPLLTIYSYKDDDELREHINNFVIKF